MRLVGIVLAFMVLPFHAIAHDWYPNECCNNIDCQPYPAELVKETPNGYLLGDGKLIPYKEAKQSQDKQFHRCPTCFFSPRGGT